MKQIVEKTGKTEEEAIGLALAELGRERDEVSVEIIERAKAGFLGIGGAPAVVRVTYERTDSGAERTPGRQLRLMTHNIWNRDANSPEWEKQGFDCSAAVRAMVSARAGSLFLTVRRTV